MGFFLFERNLHFSFCLATLEIATKKILKCDLWEIPNKRADEINVAIFYAAYIQACRERYKRPIYKATDAVGWITFLSPESKAKFIEACDILMGELQAKPSDQKKS